MIAAEVEPAEPLARRRSARAAVSLDAGLGSGGFARALCRVVDLSMHGAALQTYSALKRGSMVRLTLPQVGARTAKIVRADDFSAGCEFVEPLRQAEFDRLLALDASLDRHR